ncbi:MAG: hypothetical protein ABR608_03590, partial [Pseudonocardiaceae bacterium]
REAIADSASAAHLRGRLTDELVAAGTIVSKEVEAAFRRVPRHLFAPGATLDDSYAQDIVRIKRDEHGTTISAVSAPQIQAMMLKQAQLGAGMRVLEIGSGGYNAALIAELVGETGQVTTVDIDPDVVDRVRDCLTTAGYRRVNVVLADAEGGVPDHAPYDRIIVTVGAWDIPPAWSDQLVGDGLMVVDRQLSRVTRGGGPVAAGQPRLRRGQDPPIVIGHVVAGSGQKPARHRGAAADGRGGRGLLDRPRQTGCLVLPGMPAPRGEERWNCTARSSPTGRSPRSERQKVRPPL